MGEGCERGTHALGSGWNQKSHRHETSVKLVLPGDFAKHTMKEGTKAIAKYMATSIGVDAVLGAFFVSGKLHFLW